MALSVPLPRFTSQAGGGSLEIDIAALPFTMDNIPQDIADALARAGMAEFFANCTPAHRNQYLKWIGEAKRPETRKVRIRKAMEMISNKCAEEKTRAKKRV